MPTQEEKLAAVEQNLIQFKTETIRAYQDMAMQVTMLKGLTETTIGRLASIQWQMDQRFNAVDTTLNEHTEHTIRIGPTLSTIKKLFGHCMCLASRFYPAFVA